MQLVLPPASLDGAVLHQILGFCSAGVLQGVSEAFQRCTAAAAVCDEPPEVPSLPVSHTIPRAGALLLWPFLSLL